MGKYSDAEMCIRDRQILAPELNDRMLADFLDMDSNITVNLHIRTIDQAKAIKLSLIHI